MSMLKNFLLYSICLLLLTGMSLFVVIYAGPCYIQTRTISTNELGCAGTYIGPDGACCPSIRNPIVTGTVRACGYSIVHNKVGIGTSGNKSSGYMSQGSTNRPCYTYLGCEATAPYWDGNLPFLQHMIFDCQVKIISPSSSTRLSFEPTGGACPGH
ncbi:MAG: hypothetical protein LBE18_09095 [Planctomycetaceae bacterium]|jgi:hypothetical protein|nr:hypothetical protein [Planctomycetaceae bacterium]